MNGVQRTEEVLSSLMNFDGKNIATLQACSATLRLDNQWIEQLIEWTIHGPPQIQIGATWLLKDQSEAGACIPEVMTVPLFELLKQALPWAAKLHLLQLLPRLVIPARPRPSWLQVLQGLAADENKMVRAWALHGMVCLADGWNRYRTEVRSTIDNVSSQEPAAVQARLRATRREFPWLAQTRDSQ